MQGTMERQGSMGDPVAWSKLKQADIRRKEFLFVEGLALFEQLVGVGE